MSKNNILGIIFANSHDAILGDLAKSRSMGSVPFGGRYRMIDFSLSNLSNAGVDKVGIITKANYYSLMSHLGTGKPWDLDRKNGGLSILPPYASADAQVYKGRLEAVYGILEYLLEAEEENVVLCDSDVVANIDIKKVLKFHKEKEADITVVYTHGNKPAGQNDMMHYTFDNDGRINSVNFEGSDDCDYSLDTIIIDRKLLIDIVTNETAVGRISLSHSVFGYGYKKYKIYGFEHNGFSAVMDSPKSYFNASMALLDKEVRDDLFNRNNPIHTKTRDDMPARYGIDASVKGSLVADGCIIEGTVHNSILFRGVEVKKGAVVKDCVLMESTVVGENSELVGMITDRFVTVSQNKNLNGKNGQFYLPKNSNV